MRHARTTRPCTERHVFGTLRGGKDLLTASAMHRRRSVNGKPPAPLTPLHQFFPNSAGYRLFVSSTPLRGLRAENNVIYLAQQRNKCDLLFLVAVRNSPSPGPDEKTSKNELRYGINFNSASGQRAISRHRTVRSYRPLGATPGSARLKCGIATAFAAVAGPCTRLRFCHRVNAANREREAIC